MKIFIGILFIITVFVTSCGPAETPKPRGFFRIDFPEKKYRLFDSSCPFSFEYPVYSEMVNDRDRNAEPCFYNIETPRFKCTIHLSYKDINKNLATFIDDAHTLAYKHTIKADAIDEKPIADTKRKVYGLMYDIQGNAASPLQFYLTDSLKHFLRGSLYFNVPPNKDSLAPAITFFRKDILHLIETLQWKD